MKYIKKSLLVLAVLLLICGCASQKRQEDVPDTGLKYIEELKNYQAKEKNINNTKDNQEFEKFLDDIFIKLVSESYLYMHNSVENYKALNIEKPKVEWGELEYSIESDSEEYIEQLVELRKFDYDSLSYKEQYDYDLFEYSLLETIASAFYERYDLLFSKGTDILSGIIVTLDEFTFYDEESINDYLELLKDVDKYLNDALVYTKAQADNGLYLSDSSIDYNLDFIDSYVSKVDDNSLILSFNSKLDSIDFINEETKAKYKEDSTNTVKSEVIPAFNKVKDELKKYIGKGSNEDLALCNIDPNYAELTFMLNTSSNKSINEIYQITCDALDDLIANFNTAAYDEDAVNEYYKISESKKYGAFGLEDKETLDYLREHLSVKFPELKEAEYTVSRLDSSSASDNTVAYYVSPPLDNLSLNVIRTNPNAMGYDIVYDYVVLAHEGFPGHLYQNIYFQMTNPNRFRATQSFIGYTEGYASYVELEALDFAGLKNKHTADIYRYFYMAEYLIDSIVDMGVNYYGWSMDDLKQYLKDEDLNEEAATSLYEMAIDRPGVLDRYGVGYAMIHDLKQNAQKELGDAFNEIDFNRLLIEHGELPFCIVKESIDSYIKSK